MQKMKNWAHNNLDLHLVVFLVRRRKSQYKKGNEFEDKDQILELLYVGGAPKLSKKSQPSLWFPTSWFWSGALVLSWSYWIELVGKVVWSMDREIQ